MFKFILEFILITIIIFFVWNILKRLFFTTFYKSFPSNNQQGETDVKKTSKKEAPIKWDAETIDYEEIKDDHEQKK